MYIYNIYIYIYIYIRQPLGPPGCARRSNESVNPMKASRLEGFKASIHTALDRVGVIALRRAVDLIAEGTGKLKSTYIYIYIFFYC